MRTTPIALLASLAVAVAACADDGDDAADRAVTTAPPATSVTAAASTSAPGARGGAGVSLGDGIVEEVLTPVVGQVTNAPSPVVGTDGRTYLAYELLLINATTTPVVLESVTALDAATGAELQEHTGDDLVGHSRVIGALPSDGPAEVRLTGGQAALVWLDPSLVQGAEVPATLAHELSMTFDEAPNPLLPAAVTETIAPVAVSDVPAAVISPPLDGEGWFDGNGCCAEVTPHVGSANPINGTYEFAERYAVDWVQLDANGRIWSDDPTQMSSYAYYDAPVYAVADGVIEVVADDLPDEQPGANPPVGKLQVTEFGGNHVVQRFEQAGHTYYAFYAHLVPGSARASVQVGQEIKAGDPIGRLGNSGNSSSPHLHFHLMDSPNPLASNGLPYVFDSQVLEGTADGMAALDAADQQGEPLALAPNGPTGERTNAMPLWLDVVTLEAARP